MKRICTFVFALVCTFPLFASGPSLELSDWICQNCGGMADLDGDGLDDLFDFKSRELRRNLGASFGGPVALTGIAGNEYLSAVGDYNGDGFADLVLWPDRGPHDEGPNRFAWGNGRGGFTSAGPAFPKEYGALGQRPPADFNSDGKLDLVLMKPEIKANQEPFVTLSFLAGNGDGTFALDQAISFRGSAYPYMAIADFNRDGRWDLVRTGYHPDSLYFHYADAEGRLGVGRERFVGRYVNRVQGGDVNGDGFADLVVETWDVDDGAAVALLFGDGNGRFPAYTGMERVNSSWSPVIGDIIPGGGDELAFTHGNGQLTIYSAVNNEMKAVARVHVKGSSYYRAGLVRYRSSNHSDFLLTVRDFSAVPNIDRSKIVLIEGELPEVEAAQIAAPRRARAMGRGPTAHRYGALVSGTCVPPSLDDWSFTREGIFVDFEPREGTQIRGAMVGDKLAAQVISGDRILGGTLTLTPDHLRGYLYNRSENACGGRVHVDGIRMR